MSFKVTILVPVESPNATSYVRIIPTCLLSCTISEIWWIISSIFALDRRVPLFNALSRG